MSDAQPLTFAAWVCGLPLLALGLAVVACCAASRTTSLATRRRVG